MNKSETIETIKGIGIIPVIRAETAELAIRAVEALRDAGLAILEITMTVPGAVGVIEQVARRYGSETVVGAGTVLDAETAQACINAGAQFIVSPALDLETISCCRRHEIAVMPGALTPTEVVTGWKAGADLIKVFPAGAVGGAKYIKALKAPLPQIDLVPTGGVSLETAADFIKAGAAAMGVGSELVDAKALANNGQDHIITERAKEFIRIVKEARSS
jgi:2-dehydro-3-deoxyphosphogluconate aldolase/(4S)-4-hydroxy-2-oxoglutarate aldolase